MNNIDSLLAQLTLEEKDSLIEGVDSWYTNAVPRLGIPAIVLTDGPHGVRRVKESTGGFGVAHNEPSTAFPCSATLASSWDTDLAFRMGRAIGEESAAMGVGVLLAPGVNIKRSPLCGRNFEYFSEDPLVSGAFGEAFVRGVQSTGTGCTLKHFAANSSEDFRFTGDSVVDERALREIYLRAFERIVRHAQPAAVMCAYNRVNGTLASQNGYLLNAILRDEWGFDGVVMTDWGATCDRVEGLKAGCDLDMPGGVVHNRRQVIEAARGGDLPVETLDRAVGRILRLVTNSATTPRPALNLEVHAKLSCEIAMQSAVLLKNDGVLPLSGSERIVVVGEFFERLRFQGAGSSLINPPSVISARQAFDTRGVRYDYQPGFRSMSQEREVELENEALAAAEVAELVLFFGGLTDFEESEGFDRQHMRLAENQTWLLEQLLATGTRVVFVLHAGAPVELPFFDRLAALLDMYLPGMHGGEATAALLFGEASPCGKLAESWPQRAEDSSCAADYNRGPIACYYESIYVGYRFYDKAKTRLRFPFGFGLSYTSFGYSNLHVSRAEGRVHVTVDVTNTGGREGAEVVQLYVKNARSTVFKAEKELRAFAKVPLAPGETKPVSMTFEESDLAWWNVASRAWVLENGDHELCVGASSADIRLRAPLEISAGEQSTSPYPESVNDAWSLPPSSIPASFAQLLGRPVPERAPSWPLTLESPLEDFKQSFAGRIIYAAIMRVVGRDYRRAFTMPPSLERDQILKNSWFVLQLLPKNSMRSMCMSSGGRFTWQTANALTEIANGHLLRGLRWMFRKR